MNKSSVLQAFGWIIMEEVTSPDDFVSSRHLETIHRKEVKTLKKELNKASTDPEKTMIIENFLKGQLKEFLGRAQKKELLNNSFNYSNFVSKPFDKNELTNNITQGREGDFMNSYNKFTESIIDHEIDKLGTSEYLNALQQFKLEISGLKSEVTGGDIVIGPKSIQSELDLDDFQKNKNQYTKAEGVKESKRKGVEELLSQLNEEIAKPNPDQSKISLLQQQIKDYDYGKANKAATEKKTTFEKSLPDLLKQYQTLDISKINIVDNEGKTIDYQKLGMTDADVKFALLAGDYNVSGDVDPTMMYGDGNFNRRRGFFPGIARFFDLVGSKNVKDFKLGRAVSKTDAGTFTGGDFFSMFELAIERKGVDNKPEIYSNLWNSFARFSGISKAGDAKITTVKDGNSFLGELTNKVTDDPSIFESFRNFQQLYGQYMGDIMMYEDGISRIASDYNISGLEAVRGSLPEQEIQTSQVDLQNAVNNAATQEKDPKKKKLLQIIANTPELLSSLAPQILTVSGYMLKQIGKPLPGVAESNIKSPVNLGVGTAGSVNLGNNAALTAGVGVSLKGVSINVGVDKTREFGKDKTGTEYPVASLNLGAGGFGGYGWLGDIYAGGYASISGSKLLNLQNLQNDLDGNSAKYISVGAIITAGKTGVTTTLNINYADDEVAGLEMTGAAIETKYFDIFKETLSGLKELKDPSSIASYLNTALPASMRSQLDKNFSRTSKDNLEYHSKLISSIILGMDPKLDLLQSEKGLDIILGQLSHIYRLGFVDTHIRELQTLNFKSVGAMFGMLFDRKFKQLSKGELGASGLFGVRTKTMYFEDERTNTEANEDKLNLIGAERFGTAEEFGFHNGLVDTLNRSYNLNPEGGELVKKEGNVIKMSKSIWNKANISFAGSKIGADGASVINTKKEFIDKYMRSDDNFVYFPAARGADLHTHNKQGLQYDLIFFLEKDATGKVIHKDIQPLKLTDIVSGSIDIASTFESGNNSYNLIDIQNALGTEINAHLSYVVENNKIIFNKAVNSAVASFSDGSDDITFPYTLDLEGVLKIKYFETENKIVFERTPEPKEPLTLGFGKVNYTETTGSKQEIRLEKPNLETTYTNFVNEHIQKSQSMVNNKLELSKFRLIKYDTIAGNGRVYKKEFTDFCLAADTGNRANAAVALNKLFRNYSFKFDASMIAEMMDINMKLIGTKACTRCIECESASYNKSVSEILKGRKTQTMFNNTFGSQYRNEFDIARSGLVSELGNGLTHQSNELTNFSGVVFGYARGASGSFDLKHVINPNILGDVNKKKEITNGDFKQRITKEILDNQIIKDMYIAKINDAIKEGDPINSSNILDVINTGRVSSNGVEYSISAKHFTALYPDCANEMLLMNIDITPPNSKTPNDITPTPISKKPQITFSSYANISTAGNRAFRPELNIGTGFTVGLREKPKTGTNPKGGNSGTGPKEGGGYEPNSNLNDTVPGTNISAQTFDSTDGSVSASVYLNGDKVFDGKLPDRLLTHGDLSITISDNDLKALNDFLFDPSTNGGGNQGADDPSKFRTSPLQQATRIDAGQNYGNPKTKNVNKYPEADNNTQTIYINKKDKKKK